LDTPAPTLPTSTWASFNQVRSTQGRIPTTLHNPHQQTGSGGPVFFGGSSAAAASWFVPWRRAAPSAVAVDPTHHHRQGVMGPISRTDQQLALLP
jgi:hypothetical protein